ncbi:MULTISPECIES: AraC family transcriptional regulator [unclassified Oleiphilus]|uniref:AraC family transcriptional regulator n=2 Tax=Oleiphilus TaxID=141450 RepID=UPI0007C3FB84|nr:MULTISPECIES: AraC family transcriptional regulator [unclassified Oleiphilus]KZY48200.1 hypothetical protein A3732_06040 [Oleiphilus sp. HI0050]KZZ35611.1 hypothetical protein A3756_15175 [Oleiphilus sp. HI0086]KZZ37141.1 hypothetical protein A3757_12370 [Oleiphilus sp. HI0117]KZZ55908.1 hypothetical protein A3761_10675 [Oleiphilus sp. HI0123]
MSEPSNWPLSDRQATRIRVPKHILQQLALHPIARQIFASSIGYYPSAAKHEMERIAHDDYILIYCAEGQGYLSTGHYKGEIHQGDLFILPPETAHQYRSDPETPWTVFWFHFRGDLADSYYRYLFKASDTSVVKAHDVQTLARFRELIGIARSSFTLDSYIYVSSLLSHLLISTAHTVMEDAKKYGGISVEKTQDFMRKNIGKSLSLADLADVSRVSKYHFSRRYRELTGISPLKHFSNMKIEQACSLLEQTNISISDIAYQLGYDDALYFSRVFKKLMKVSPRNYRKELRKRLDAPL